MPRKNNNAEIWNELSEFGAIRNKTGTAGSTTLTAAAAAGATTLTVAAITNFADTDIIRIGAGNEMEVAVISGAPAGSTITLQQALVKAHANGDAVVEQAKTVLGIVTDDGVETDVDADFSPIQAATQRMVVAYVGGHFGPWFRAAIESFNLENLATSYGMKETEIIGAGSAANKYRLAIDGTKLGNQLDQGFYFTGLMHDQVTNVEIQYWGVEVDWSQAGKHTFKRGEPIPVIPIVGRATSAKVIYLWS